MPEQNAAEITRRWWRFHMRRLPHVRESLEYLGANEEERIQRIDTFSRVINRLNYFLEYKGAIPEKYADIEQLKQLLGDKKVPTLESIVSQAESSHDISEAIKRTIEFGKTDFPSWADQDFRLPTISASSILLEGFGYYLGTLVHSENKDKVMETKTAFVRGAEEILLIEYTRSLLTRDIIGWMKEEKPKFPTAIHAHIDGYK